MGEGPLPTALAKRRLGVASLLRVGFVLLSALLFAAFGFGLVFLVASAAMLAYDAHRTVVLRAQGRRVRLQRQMLQMRDFEALVQVRRGCGKSAGGEEGEGRRRGEKERGEERSTAQCPHFFLFFFFSLLLSFSLPRVVCVCV